MPSALITVVDGRLRVPAFDHFGGALVLVVSWVFRAASVSEGSCGLGHFILPGLIDTIPHGTMGYNIYGRLDL